MENLLLNTVSEIQISYQPKVPAIHRPRITTSNDAYKVFMEIFDPMMLNIKEEVVVIYLNRGNRVLGSYKLSSGGINCTVIDIRILLGIALKSLASGIMIAHSHPSGELKPSKSDIALTLKLKEAASLMDISFMEHMIVTTDSYYSFVDNGML